MLSEILKVKYYESTKSRASSKEVFIVEKVGKLQEKA